MMNPASQRIPGSGRRGDPVGIFGALAKTIFGRFDVVSEKVRDGFKRATTSSSRVFIHRRDVLLHVRSVRGAAASSEMVGRAEAHPSAG
jgi:hypothetical protein